MRTTLLNAIGFLLLAMAIAPVGCSGSGDDDDATTDATPGAEVTADDVPGMVENCDPNSSDPCEVFICSLAEAVDECEDAGTEEACEPVLSCVADYYNCVCGTGTYQYDAILTCNDTYLSCLVDAGYATY